MDKQRITVDLPLELYRKVRQEILKRYDGKKGSLTKAVVEALELWLEKEE